MRTFRATSAVKCEEELIFAYQIIQKKKKCAELFYRDILSVALKWQKGCKHGVPSEKRSHYSVVIDLVGKKKKTC